MLVGGTGVGKTAIVNNTLKDVRHVLPLNLTCSARSSSAGLQGLIEYKLIKRGGRYMDDILTVLVCWSQPGVQSVSVSVIILNWCA